MARAGRKRKPGPREPNGKLSRNRRDWTGETERAAVATAVGARVRLFALSEDQAKQPHAGTVVGRMYLAGQLGDLRDDHERASRRYSAAVRYQETRHRHQVATCSPVPDYRGHRAEVEPEPIAPEKADERQASNWKWLKDYHDDMMEVIGEGLPRQAVQQVIGRDIDMPYLRPVLLAALDRLAKFFFG